MISYGDIKSGEAMVPAAEVRDWNLDLTDIKLDQSAQPREHLNTERTAEYAEAMKAGDQFPPLVVFHDGETYWLADGFHRHYAAQQAGRKHIRCHVRQGGLRDAILWSVGANAKHGLARSDVDKERAVTRLLSDDEWSTWSDRDIAKRCRVSHPYVAKVRAKHAPVTGNVSSERAYRTKHGTVATMKTAGINASRTQFQAKASEDNGSITGGAGAVTGEASRLASGRTDAGEAASVDLPTISEVAREAGEIVAERNIFDELVALWKEAGPGVRQDFKAYIRGSEFVARIKPTESNPATGTGGGDVDRSAERASSAVEVGAPVSPERAHDIPAGSAARGQAALSGECPEAPPMDGARKGPSGTAAKNPKTPAAHPTSRQVTAAPEVAPPTSGAPQFNNPRCLKSETCHLAHSRDCCFDCSMAWAQRPKDEQIRLWAEANEAARSA